MIETSVLIQAERSRGLVRFEDYAAYGNAYISSITVSELLGGVHLAQDEARRNRRRAFVEGILTTIPTLVFSAETARIHAELYAALRQAGSLIGAHDHCREALDDWYRVVRKATWSNRVEVQSVFPKTEAVGSFTVFNIKGNNYRLIVSIDYQRQVVYIKYVLTHAQYDQERWKHDPCF